MWGMSYNQNEPDLKSAPILIFHFNNYNKFKVKSYKKSDSSNQIKRNYYSEFQTLFLIITFAQGWSTRGSGVAGGYYFWLIFLLKRKFGS